MSDIRLGVNLDHVATLRQARGTDYPDPVAAAALARDGGADSITLHLREDRRHVQECDVTRFLAGGLLPLNLEMAATPEMVAFACRVRPRYVCLVPERRAELTTEGGLDVDSQLQAIGDACRRLGAAGVTVALFVDPDPAQLKVCRASGAPQLEIHTGRYADAAPDRRQGELERIRAFAAAAQAAGMEVHAGHGLRVDNVAPIAAIPQIVELNIGHAIVARAVFVGLVAAVAEIKQTMRAARRDST
ncbi:MAG: pyridoxine 5'-phosphate synthase [Gammaproteobacteria bacterium]|nr:pyridoxine 5'-phosphate synthase [Gammaproteobacteria bacterium]